MLCSCVLAGMLLLLLDQALIQKKRCAHRHTDLDLVLAPAAQQQQQQQRPAHLQQQRQQLASLW
jgi:hypothetical protein